MRAEQEGRFVRVRRVGGRVLRYRLEREHAHGSFSVSVRAGREEAVVRDLTRSEEQALRVLELLASGAVFPCHLEEVAEDLLIEGL